MRWLLRGNKETVQNMPDAIFGLAAIRSSQILARMKVCALLFTRSLQPQPQPPTLHRLLYQAKGSVWPAAQTSALLCRFSTGIVMMRSVGRSLTEIESVARQIWTSLGASGGCCWPFSPSPASLDLIRSLLWPSGPFKGLTSHQPGLLMEPFLHFMDAWSLISIKIIRFYLVLYIAQTVPTHPESFQTDRSRNRRYVKWIGNALPYENLNPDIVFNSYWSSFFNSLIGVSRSIIHLIHFTFKKVCVTWPLTLLHCLQFVENKEPQFMTLMMVTWQKESDTYCIRCHSVDGVCNSWNVYVSTVSWFIRSQNSNQIVKYCQPQSPWA